MVDRFRHLRIGVALVLAFVGLKMCAGPWIRQTGWGDRAVILISLAIIGGILASAVAASLPRPRLPGTKGK
jgi:predicted tellurium resistance membrane protein TerC